jgi:endonuclease G, mitochondrial
VNAPNINTVNANRGTYRTTVDTIEKEIGFYLLSGLPDQLQGILAAEAATGPT